MTLHQHVEQDHKARHGHFNASIIVTQDHLTRANPSSSLDQAMGLSDGLYLDLAIYLARIEVVQHGTYEVIEVSNVYELPPNQGGGWRVEMHIKPLSDEGAADRAMDAVTQEIVNHANELTKTVEYLANSTHQAHHKGDGAENVGWRDCVYATCKSAQQVVGEPF